MSSNQQDSAEMNAETESRIKQVFKYKIVILIVLVVMIAGLLVSVSIGLYNSSGTAQLDLSRPEYSTVIDKIEYVESSKYPNSGKLDEESLKEFEKRYDDRAETLVDIEAFSQEPLTNKSLGLPKID